MSALTQNDSRAKPGDVEQELADLVWKHFADEIREAMIEAAEAMSGEKTECRRGLGERKQVEK